MHIWEHKVTGLNKRTLEISAKMAEGDPLSKPCMGVMREIKGIF